MSFAVLASPGFGQVLLSVCPSADGTGMAAGCKYVLSVLAARLPMVGGIVYESEDEFYDELAARTGFTKKRIRDEVLSAMKLGWLYRRRVVGRGHVEVQPVVPSRLAQEQVKSLRMEVGEAPRVVYAVSELTVDAIEAALREADSDTREARGQGAPTTQGDATEGHRDGLHHANG